MTLTPLKLFRVLITALVLALLTGVVWIQVSPNPVAAQEPESGEPVLSILIIPEGEEFSVAGVGTTPVFEVGDTFKVSVVALGVTDPGLFGGQFEVYYDTAHLAGVDGSLSSGSALEPVVVALSDINNVDGSVAYAASRKGDLENLAGNVVVASFSFEAVGATGEGQTTLIDLENVKLGAKGGVEIPVSGVVDLEIIIVDDDGQVDEGDVTGNVFVEGRDAANQAGHTVTLDGSSATTDPEGMFVFKNVADGTYSAEANSPGFLKSVCDELSHSNDAVTTLLDVTLLAGDINDDMIIDITDAVAIGTALGTADEIADLNADGEVDVLDLILMAVNYDQTSEANPWVCQLGDEL